MDGEGFIEGCRLIWLGLYLIVLLLCCRESTLPLSWALVGLRVGRYGEG
jgi:hypothetical protein